MRFQTTETFVRDFKRLNDSERARFRAVAKDAFSPACDAWLEDPNRSWPAALRVHRMKKIDRVWEMTWSFAGPDGRATFEFVRSGGDVAVRWRRIGSHSIYESP